MCTEFKIRIYESGVFSILIMIFDWFLIQKIRILRKILIFWTKILIFWARIRIFLEFWLLISFTIWSENHNSVKFSILILYFGLPFESALGCVAPNCSQKCSRGSDVGSLIRVSFCVFFGRAKWSAVLSTARALTRSFPNFWVANTTNCCRSNEKQWGKRHPKKDRVL